MAEGGRARPERELKARWDGDPTELRRRLLARGWEPTFEGSMRDRIFDTRDASLAERDEVVRVRLYRERDGPERAVLGWKGAARSEEGFKTRDELETSVGDASVAVAILRRLGYDRVTTRIDREIEVFRSGGVQLRIERYPRMDVLIEIEGEPAEVERRLPDVGLPASEWRAWGLPRFVARYEERTGRRARLAEDGSVDGDDG